MRPLIAAALIAGACLSAWPQNGNGHTQAEPAKVIEAPQAFVQPVVESPSVEPSAQDCFEREIFEIQASITSPIDREALRQWVVWLTKKRAKMAGADCPDCEDVLKRCGLDDPIKTAAVGPSRFFTSLNLDAADQAADGGSEGPVGRIGKAGVSGVKKLSQARPLRKVGGFFKNRKPVRRLFGRVFKRGC